MDKCEKHYKYLIKALGYILEFLHFLCEVKDQD